MSSLPDAIPNMHINTSAHVLAVLQRRGYTGPVAVGMGADGTANVYISPLGFAVQVSPEGGIAAAAVAGEAALPPVGDVVVGYHAHVYFETAAEKAHALWLREALATRFAERIYIGRWHDMLVGPHTKPMYQVAFKAPLLAEVAPFIMTNHGNLSVLLHPLSGDDVADHTLWPLWLGQRLPVDLNGL